MHTKTSVRKTSTSKLNTTFSVYYAIDDVPVTEWELAINPSDVFLSYHYLSVLEKSKPAGLAFRYVVLYKNNNPVCGLAFQLLNVGHKELGGVLNLQDKGWLLQKLNPAINRMLFSCHVNKPNYFICCGSLIVSGEHGISYSTREGFNETVEKMEAILQAIKKSVANADVCAWAVKDFFDVSSIDQMLMAKGFVNLPMDPEMMFFVRNEWKTFDDYLASLSAKYRLKANNAVKKIEGIHIRELNEREITQYAQHITELYHNVQQRSTVRLMRVNASYFIELKKKLKNVFYLKGFFKDDELIAFTCGLVYQGNHEAHFIGIDYRYNKSLQLYQNMLYLFIRDAIEKRSKHLYFGRTAMEMKTTVGAKAYSLQTYFKLENGFLNKMIKPLIKRASPEEWTPRNPFKDQYQII